MWQDQAVSSSHFGRGLELFDAAEFFEAHEILEDVWRESNGPERLFLQGLIQVAVAFHHHSTGNIVGARSLLKRAERNLTGYPESYLGIELPPLRHSLREWQQALAEGKAAPPHPRIGPSHRGANPATTENPELH